jgi:hypothetical protein
MTEEYDPLGCNAIYFRRSLPTFRRDVSSPSSGSESKPRKKPTINRVSILLDLLFDPEDGDDTFLRNVGGCLLKYAMLQPLISYSPYL